MYRVNAPLSALGYYSRDDVNALDARAKQVVADVAAFRAKPGYRDLISHFDDRWARYQVATQVCDVSLVNFFANLVGSGGQVDCTTAYNERKSLLNEMEADLAAMRQRAASAPSGGAGATKTTTQPAPSKATTATASATADSTVTPLTQSSFAPPVETGANKTQWGTIAAIGGIAMLGAAFLLSQRRR